MNVGRFVRSGGSTRSRSLILGIVFVIPFVFILFIAGKEQAEAALLQFTPPTEWRLLENIGEVIGCAQRVDGHRDAEQPHPDGRFRDPDRPVRSDGRLRPPAPP